MELAQAPGWRAAFAAMVTSGPGGGLWRLDQPGEPMVL